MDFFKKRAPSEPVQDLANLRITDARAGDALSVSGAGENFTDLDFTTDRLTRYEGGSRRWFEISGPYKERRVTLRVGGDEDVEVGLHADGSKPTLEQLGLAEEDLAEIDERQNTGDNFEFDGKVWYYRLSREVYATRDDQSSPIGFYYWEFQEQNGKEILTIRKGEGEPFAATRYTVIPAGDITVYRSHPNL